MPLITGAWSGMGWKVAWASLSRVSSARAEPVARARTREATAKVFFMGDLLKIEVFSQRVGE